ncbi:MAG: hypothetical protein OFPI_00510 [Osedax symbiont Rs2]|nr:MAG: hypothetical protein OFPI_00510 [Osedax symbiont Rs2]
MGTPIANIMILINGAQVVDVSGDVQVMDKTYNALIGSN